MTVVGFSVGDNDNQNRETKRRSKGCDIALARVLVCHATEAIDVAFRMHRFIVTCY